jgi:hypothetical protein
MDWDYPLSSRFARYPGLHHCIHLKRINTSFYSAGPLEKYYKFEYAAY